MSQIRPIQFDPQGSFVSDHAQLPTIYSRLEAVREEILKVDLQLFADGNVPSKKQPLDAGFIEMPERILEDYRTNGDKSELGRILLTAKRIQESVDRVVVLGIGGSYMGARALMECCCQPYFNEYSRAERGGRPRMYFEGNNVDNDWSQGLLQLLRTDPDPW